MREWFDWINPIPPCSDQKRIKTTFVQMKTGQIGKTKKLCWVTTISAAKLKTQSTPAETFRQLSRLLKSKRWNSSQNSFCFQKWRLRICSLKSQAIGFRSATKLKNICFDLFEILLLFPICRDDGVALTFQSNTKMSLSTHNYVQGPDKQKKAPSGHQTRCWNDAKIPDTTGTHPDEATSTSNQHFNSFPCHSGSCFETDFENTCFFQTWCRVD